MKSYTILTFVGVGMLLAAFILWIVPTEQSVLLLTITGVCQVAVSFLMWFFEKGI